jgi:acyl dehydratase
MRLIADNYLSTVAGLPSPGLEELRWSRPVFAGDLITVRATIESTRASNTKPDRGILTTTFTATNTSRETVMSFRAVSFVLRRHRGAERPEPTA